MNNFSRVGIIGGAVFTILADLRYFVIWPDMSTALICTAIGCLIMAVSWLYGAYKNLYNTVDSVEEYLSVKPWRKKSK